MKKPLISLNIVNKNGETVQVATSRRRKRIYSILKADKSKDRHYKLMVRYADGGTNSGDYVNKKDAIYMLRAFTEPE